MKKELQKCLEYCKQQNSTPDCKNCGLNQEMIDSVVDIDNIGMLRQWLNEDRNATPMVTDENILFWLNPK